MHYELLAGPRKEFFVSIRTSANGKRTSAVSGQINGFSIRVILTKIHKTIATRAALFGSNMHQIVFRLGLCPRPHWGAYSAPHTP